MKNKFFCIAEQIVWVSMPDGERWRGMLPSFVPFECSCPRDKKWMCSLEIVPDRIMIDLSATNCLAEVSHVWGEVYRLYEVNGWYVIDLQTQRSGRCFRMIANSTFTRGLAYIGSAGYRSGEALNHFLMMLFAQSAVLHRSFLIHASVVMKEARGYAFLGESGTGKSTHSRLWMSLFSDAELLNDDNPAVRVTEEGRVYIYGTPWSGKTRCYKNQKVELAAWVRLAQAPVNSFSWKKEVEAFVTLLPSCSGMRWNDELYAELCDLLEQCIRYVPIGYLQCLPNEEAALLCYDEIRKRNE